MKEELLRIVNEPGIHAPVSPAHLYRPKHSAEPEAGSLLDSWRIVCRRKVLIGILAALGLAVGIGITLPQSPLYRATTTIEIQTAKDDPMTMTMRALHLVDNSAPTGEAADIQTQVKILESRTLIQQALDKVNWAAASGIAPNSTRKPLWNKLFPVSKPDGNRENLLERTAKNLKVSLVGQTNIVEVSFDATDPKMAAEFANALTVEFIKENMQSRWMASRRTSDLLAGQLEDVRSKLQSSEDALQAYARQNGLIYTGDKQNVSKEKLRQLQSSLSNAEADRVEKQSRFEIAQKADAETLPDVLNDGNLRMLESTLVDLRRQEAELSITFKPDYPKTKALNAEMAELESAIAKKREEIVDRISNELHQSQVREHLLSAAYASQAKLVTDDSEKSIQYDLLEHEADTNRRIYEAMLQQVKESSIMSAMKASNLRVIDPAFPPQHPYKPNLPVNGAAGLFSGLICGVLTVVLRARTDGSVREPGDAGLLLGICELGTIPNSESQPKRLASGVTLFPKETETSLSVPFLLNPAVADSFRAVLASILFSGPGERRRVLVVTSASPGEGKTSTATNLAVTLANMGRKVLLIDGDVRSPRLHQIFELDNSTGLSDLLAQSNLDEKLLDASVRRTASKSLYVLPSGPAVAAGADLFFSNSMPAIIRRYREQFDMVLIDTPPMLSMPDARIMGCLSDAVILVVRAGRTTRSAIQAAFRRLIEDHAPVLGIVLNDWNPKSSAHQYYAPYNYRGAKSSSTAAARPGTESK